MEILYFFVKRKRKKNKIFKNNKLKTGPVFKYFASGLK